MSRHRSGATAPCRRQATQTLAAGCACGHPRVESSASSTIKLRSIGPWRSTLRCVRKQHIGFRTHHAEKPAPRLPEPCTRLQRTPASRLCRRRNHPGRDQRVNPRGARLPGVGPAIRKSRIRQRGGKLPIRDQSPEACNEPVHIVRSAKPCISLVLENLCDIGSIAQQAPGAPMPCRDTPSAATPSNRTVQVARTKAVSSARRLRTDNGAGPRASATQRCVCWVCALQDPRSARSRTNRRAGTTHQASASPRRSRATIPSCGSTVPV